MKMLRKFRCSMQFETRIAYYMAWYKRRILYAPTLI